MSPGLVSEETPLRPANEWPELTSKHHGRSKACPNITANNRTAAKRRKIRKKMEHFPSGERIGLSQRDFGLQPKVATELPWVGRGKFYSTRNGLRRQRRNSVGVDGVGGTEQAATRSGLTHLPIPTTR